MRTLTSAIALSLASSLTLGLGAEALAQTPAVPVPIPDTAAAASPLTGELAVAAIAVDDGIAVSFFPTDAKAWAALADSNVYLVTRREVDAGGAPAGPVEEIGRAGVMQDSAWFADNADGSDGILGAVGQLLYDPRFRFPDNDLLDEDALKFNFAVFETTVDFAIAEALGLGIVDASIPTGREGGPARYFEYAVSVPGTSLTGAVVVEATASTYGRNDASYAHDFAFPGGRSLRDMHAMAYPEERHELRAIARAYGDSIVLRFAPTTPTLWTRAMAEGYLILRHDIASESTDTLDLVMPWRREEITEAIASDSVALGAAGILLRDRTADAGEGISMYDRVAIYENDFGMALFSAERSALAADILGLRYVDADVEPDARYEYEVQTAAITRSWDFGTVEVTNAYAPVPPPTGLRVDTLAGVAELHWDKTNVATFSGYDVERSEDGGATFVSLTPAPLVFIESERVPLSDFAFSDSIRVGVDYVYRVRGFDSFGERSEAAEVSVSASDITPPEEVSFVRATYDRDRELMTVTWTNPPLEADLLRRELTVAEINDAFDGDYEAVPGGESLGLSQDSLTYSLAGTDTDRGYFFRIASVDTAGNRSYSTVVEGIVPDLTAPEPPTALRGTIDTTGLVTVTWSPSPSRDVRGYWLYWGNSPDAELTPANKRLLADTTFTVWTEPESLAEDIYFVVRAEDDNYNRGEATEILKVERLDYVAPIAPYLLSVNERDSLLEVVWERSGSADAVAYRLYRRSAEAEDEDLRAAGLDWTELAEVRNPDTTYSDEAVGIEENYDYMVVAVDDVDLVSDYSNVKTANLAFPAERAVVTDLAAALANGEENMAARVTWAYRTPDYRLLVEDFRYEVYRSTGSDAPKPYDIVAGGEGVYADPDIQPNTLYNYAVRVRYDNGWTGDLSPVASVLAE